MFLHALQLLTRVASGLAGVMFLYMALFVYTDEAGKLQNWLVDLWVRVTARHEAYLGRGASERVCRYRR